MTDADVITIETSSSDMELLDAFKDFAYPNDLGPGVYDIHSPNVPAQEAMVRLIEKAAERSPSERQVMLTYDDRGRVETRSILAGEGHWLTSTVTYGRSDDLSTAVTDPLTRQTSLHYDPFGRRNRVTDPLLRTFDPSDPMHPVLLGEVAVPGVIMVIAVGLGIWRGARRRHYISHASDA